MTLKTEEDFFFVDHVFCIFKKELMKYVVFKYVRIYLHCIILFYLYIFAQFLNKHIARRAARLFLVLWRWLWKRLDTQSQFMEPRSFGCGQGTSSSSCVILIQSFGLRRMTQKSLEMKKRIRNRASHVDGIYQGCSERRLHGET